MRPDHGEIVYIGWTDLPRAEDGYVALKKLKHYLVHYPHLLSRPLRWAV